MSGSLWDDRLCTICGGLAHFSTEMYLRDNVPAPGLEYLCKPCYEAAIFPEKVIVLATHCAAPNCRETADGRFELLSAAGGGEVSETHYLCREHGWRWRQSLGPEAEMTVLPLSFNAREIYDKPKRLVRDDLRGAIWGEESEQIN